jgi:hypothetical protein
MRDAHNERLPTKKELGSSAHKLRQLGAAKARQQLQDQEEDLYDEVSAKPEVQIFYDADVFVAKEKIMRNFLKLQMLLRYFPLVA